MKTASRGCLLGGLAGLLLLVTGLVNIRPYYTPAKFQGWLPVGSHADDTIRIAYIGDSWAEMHGFHQCKIDSLVQQATMHPVKIRTAGISGLTSKNVYYSMFRDSAVRHTIEWGPNYCFVVAGINDTDRKMGRGYYKENMRLIVELLLHSGIKPVILEIPDYDISFSYTRRNRMTKLQYLFSSITTSSGMNCINDYTQSYYELLEECHWQDSVLSIPKAQWNPSGFRDPRQLYDEGLMHLNDNGYQVLDSIIARWIGNDWIGRTSCQRK